MGRVFKRFTANVGNKKVTSDARIDSGADISVIRLDLARRLGLNTDTANYGAVGGVGAQRSIGYEMAATVKVGKSSAELTLFIPVATVDKENNLTVFQQKHNLIGMDFLQATKTKLDYSRVHEETFVGEVELLAITDEERNALAKWSKKNFRKGRPKTKRR